MSDYHAILLAAGAGTRFGGGKLLIPWQQAPLVCAAATIALAAPVKRCVAVVGCDADDVEAALKTLGSDRLDIVRATDWNDGLSASLKRGLAALPPTSRGVIVFLGDMPLVSPQAAGPLIDALAKGAVGAEYRSDQGPAHPVAFARALYPELCAIPGDQGGRRLLMGRAGVVRLETRDAGATLDIDLKSDVDRLMALSESPADSGEDKARPASVWNKTACDALTAR